MDFNNIKSIFFLHFCVFIILITNIITYVSYNYIHIGNREISILGLDFGATFYKISGVNINPGQKEFVVKILENVYSQKKSEYIFIYICKIVYYSIFQPRDVF